MTTSATQQGLTQEENIELIRADMRTVLDMTLQYKLYHLHANQLDGYGIEMDGPGGRTPLYIFDQYAVRADAFYEKLVDLDVFPCTLGDILEDACGEFFCCSVGKNPDFSLQIAKNMIK